MRWVIILVWAMAALAPLPSQESIQAQDGSVLVLVPAGPFRMGSARGPRDQAPEHKLELGAYYIGKYEVSNAQFRAFLVANQRLAPSPWDTLAAKWGEQAPALGVSWNDAQAYCQWAGLRLPSEEEWEKAARGPEGRKYPWGALFDPDRCACSVGMETPREGPVNITAYPEGASPYGCQNMCGNAWEWTDSWYQPYPGSKLSSPDFGEKFKVLRGGCWQYTSPDFLQNTYRGWNLTVARFPQYGFRVARDP